MDKNLMKKSSSTTPADSADTYYSSAAHSAKMKTYVHFMQAAHAGDIKTSREVATDDITWDLNAGGEVPNGLPWIGLFKGEKEITQMIQSMKGIAVLSRHYYYLAETETQLIAVGKDTIKMWDMVIPNIAWSFVITFRDDKIAYIQSMEDSARVLIAYQAYKTNQAIEAWSDQKDQ
jgi:ketosteroid isomerase-like protein